MDGDAAAGRDRILRTLALGQGVYYVLTGVWPIVSPATFQLVTGPKVDFWLVKTVGGLVAVIGAVLTLAGLRRRFTPEIPILAAGSALTLASVDIVYARRGRIPRIYLLDAVPELMLILGWIAGWRRRFQ